MKGRPLEPPMKKESEFSTPSNNGEACTLNVSSFTGVTSFLISGVPAEDFGEFDASHLLW